MYGICNVRKDLFQYNYISTGLFTMVGCVWEKQTYLNNLRPNKLAGNSFLDITGVLLDISSKYPIIHCST